jgi:Fe-S-cluster containining protein
VTHLIQISKKMNLNPTVCKACGGSCCKQQPGITLPEQWGSTREEITAAIAAAFATGKWAIDWWEGDVDQKGDLDDVYFVRPHAVGFDAVRIFHGAGQDRQCTFLQKDGCSLTPTERPDGCLLLVPNKDYTNCLPEGIGNVKEKYAWAWRPYQDVIHAAAAAVGASKEDREVDDVSFWSMFR